MGDTMPRQGLFVGEEMKKSAIGSCRRIGGTAGGIPILLDAAVA
jgi:hypothetical protein